MDGLFTDSFFHLIAKGKTLTLGRWIGLIALIILLYVLWQIRAIILLFFMAIIFAVGLNRVVRQFQKSRLKRSAASGLKSRFCS
jgi:predicted PurR-regulated permease PerM